MSDDTITTSDPADDLRKQHLFLMIAAGVAIAGSFMPWVKAGIISVAGTEGDGQISAIAAGIVGVVCLAKLPSGSKATAIVGLIGMGIVGAVGGYHAFLNEDYDSNVIAVSRQPGVYIVAIAGVAGFVAALSWLQTNRKLASTTTAAPAE